METKKEYVYPVIDTIQTGFNLKRICTEHGYSVRKLQEMLMIGSFQSIYDWYSGKALPSLDNVVALSRLLEVPIEALIVCKGDN